MDSPSVAGDLSVVDSYAFSQTMDYLNEFAPCRYNDDYDEVFVDNVFIDDGHIWFGLYLDEIVSTSLNHHLVWFIIT